jgi:hypothetical protein
MKIVITIEDRDGDRVKVEMRPTASELLKQTQAGKGLAVSSAAAYALSAITHIAAESRKIERKQQGTPLIILPPGVRDS